MFKIGDKVRTTSAYEEENSLWNNKVLTVVCVYTSQLWLGEFGCVNRELTQEEIDNNDWYNLTSWHFEDGTRVGDFFAYELELVE